jgi:hypothetical protein
VPFLRSTSAIRIVEPPIPVARFSSTLTNRGYELGS